MTIEEINSLKELSTNFAQVVIDSKNKFAFKQLKSATNFDSVFAQFFSIAHESLTTSEQKTKELFEFLGGKINAPNKEEYASYIKTYFLEHLQKNGIIN